jgi:uncharacterized protein DUF6029
MRIATICLLALVAPPARAIELHIHDEVLRLEISETLVTSYNGDLGYMVTSRDASDPPGTVTHPERHFYDIINKLNASLQWRRFRLSTRFDTALWFDTPPMSCDANGSITLRSRFCQNYFQPEKLTLEYIGRVAEVTLGDFYVSFGRGIALSLRKIDELGIDTTVLGGRLMFHYRDTAATLVAGASNIQNTDQATGRSTEDPYDLITGARLEQRLLDRVIVGAHVTGGLQRRNAQSSAPQMQRDGILHYGGTIDAPRLTDWLALYLEGDGQLTTVADHNHTGYALYGSLTVHDGPIAVMLEGKHYWQLQRWSSSVDPSLPEFKPIAYNQPPTVERLVTELVAPVYDVSGGRLRVDWRVRDWLTLYVSDAFFDERGVPGGLYYQDPYGGLELRWNAGASHLFPSGGLRIERCKSGAAAADCLSGAFGGDIFQTIGHVEWDFAQELPRGLSLEAQGFALFRRGDKTFDADGQPAQWTEGNAYFALKWTPHLVFTVGYEWSTRPSPQVNQHFVNGAVQWNFTTASSLRLFAGGTRGGLKCISGVCRDFPSFTGAQIELVVRL